jgi:phage terminase large subunit-like protein
MQIVKHPAKRKTCAMGRRYGKTVLGLVVTANVLRQHGRSAWVTPTYKNGRPLWRAMVQAFAPLRAKGLVDISISERVIATKRGGFFGMYSADNIDSVRGEWFHLVVNDEAGKITEEARYDAIDPLVADSDGEIIDISTPRGRNWFWREFLAGQQESGERASFTAPTSANPMPNIQKAFRMAKDRMPERTYRQEWLAEFIEDGGIVFRHIDQAATAIPQESAQAGHQYVFGVDFGRLEDYTVVSVIDVTDRALVHIDRFNTIDWTLQVGRIAALYDRFQPTTIVAERNSMGDPVINMLYERDLPVLPFTTTNATKQTIIDGLALAFEQSQIRILKDNVLINELQAYEATQLPSGLVRYGAPSGSHDDCVMSLALAWHGASGGDMEFA